MNLDYFFKSPSENVDSFVDEEQCTSMEDHGEPQAVTTLDTSSTSNTLSKAKDLSSVDADRLSIPDSFIFPTRLVGGHLRSFSLQWMRKYDWLEYSLEVDRVFCKPCRHFDVNNYRGRFCGPFLGIGVNDWKKLGEKLSKHDSSNSHSIAIVKFKDYKCTKLVLGGSVVEMCDIHHQEIKGLLLNTQHFHFVIDLLLFLAGQNLSIRGHCENYSQSAKDSSDNMGNFLEMHKFILKYSPDIAKAYRNAKYKMLSPKIQNDILQAAAIALVHEIKIELMDSYYSILADETRDSCSNELVAVCLRYLHKGDIHERAVGFVDGSSDLSAEGISNSILLILEQLELDPDKCVGFGFDGASVMSGNRGGVQAILRRTYTRASYVHCHSHRLNLVLQHVATKDEDLKVFLV